MLPPRLCISCLHQPFCQKYAKVEQHFWCEGHEPVSETGFKNRLGRLRTTSGALLAKAQQVAEPHTLQLRKSAGSLIARSCCVACTARAGCPTSRGLEDTCEKFEPVSERGLGIRIGQLSMAPEDATAWKTFTRTAALPDGDARKEAWRAKLPQCAPKDSAKYLAWEQRNREVSPCLADPTSKAHQDWLSSLPSAKPEESPEKQAWREKYVRYTLGLPLENKMKVTASDRSALLRLASSLPVGDESRRAILSALSHVNPSDVTLDPWERGPQGLVRRAPDHLKDYVVLVYGSEKDGFHYNIPAQKKLFGYSRYLNEAPTLDEVKVKADKRLRTMGFNLK